MDFLRLIPYNNTRKRKIYLCGSEMKKYEKILEPVLRKHSWVAAAFILGSAARDALRPESDIDLALLPLPDYRPTPFDCTELAVEIESILSRTIDLGVLTTDNIVYAKEAYLSGHCVYSQNDFYRDLFGATILGLYAKLREERKEIENAYRID